MSKIKITNPYFEKEYNVVEGRGDIEYNLHNIEHGYFGLPSTEMLLQVMYEMSEWLHLRKGLI